MVCIEHFSKHLLLIPLPSKEPKHTASAFLAQVLGRFGSRAEVVTDGGGEFQGEFDTLLRNALIDHRTTRANNPQAASNRRSLRCTFSCSRNNRIIQKRSTAPVTLNRINTLGLRYDGITPFAST